MVKFPKKLQNKMSVRERDNALRSLPEDRSAVDFSSNDYLGLSRSEDLIRHADEILKDLGRVASGSTGSRLISGNHELYREAEQFLRTFYCSEEALIFNSGYDANIGFFSAVPQRGDVVLYDEYIHASIRDGLRMGNARSFKFSHNDHGELAGLLEKFTGGEAEVYVVTESVFSMDGDSPDLRSMAGLCDQYGAYLVVDEAHAIGVMGESGKGLAFASEIREKVFARILTFGKAPGVHGAAVLGSAQLKSYLVNFARSLIYTTALPPHALAAIMAAHKIMQNDALRVQLNLRIAMLSDGLEQLKGQFEIKSGNSAISTVIIPGNEQVKHVAGELSDKGFGVKAILSPTVPEGQERLRICLHTYNSIEEIEGLIDRLLIFVQPSRFNV